MGESLDDCHRNNRGDTDLHCSRMLAPLTTMVLFQRFRWVFEGKAEPSCAPRKSGDFSF
jgi:hypothetical protein